MGCSGIRMVVRRLVVVVDSLGLVAGLRFTPLVRKTDTSQRVGMGGCRRVLHLFIR
ncbi:protein of unknown function [Kyrpidia spormannii]|uniref:Uncharacterized protein n=2 Tax=Kyrpidia spormannii TaxID=2055160 RepID=A0ACA8Z972_9BACL|nr:protein of unknown function [Kyrpidia spormannii]CAB3393202.1 protein of unknown function [Kyrpidia spormannii]